MICIHNIYVIFYNMEVLYLAQNPKPQTQTLYSRKNNIHIMNKTPPSATTLGGEVDVKVGKWGAGVGS
jgi:hypothetical protein